jgi:hypothetical protein
MSALKLKGLLTRQEFVSAAGELRVWEKSLFSRRDITVPFEDFGRGIEQRTEDNIFKLFIAFISCIAFGAMMATVFRGVDSAGFFVELFVLAILLMQAKGWFKTYLAIIPTANFGNIEIRGSLHDQEKIQAFINAFQLSKAAYMREKYGKIDRSLPFEYQKNNLLWLLNDGFISQEEFNEMNDDLHGQLCQAKTRIGFRLENSI